MSLPKYREYRYSGAEWLETIPGHWEAHPCRYFVVEQTEKNENAENQAYLSLMANMGIIPYEEKGDVGNKKPEDLSKCKLVSKGDLVINSMNYGIGSYGLSDLSGVCSPVYIVLRPLLERVKARFAFRIFENKAFQTYAQSFGNGILEHRAAINWDILKGIRIGLPPIEEQEAILCFLDRETAKIDALIAEQEKLIALLAEKRQATISHAVTRGLDPNVPMKDSGVEWLGEVPAHWEVKRLRYAIDLNPSKKEAAANVGDLEVSFVPMEAIGDDGSLNLEKTRSLSDVEAGYTYFREGDVSIAKITPCFENGKGAVMTGLTGGFGFGTTELIIVRPKVGQSTGPMLDWIFRSRIFRKVGEGYMYGAGGQRRVPDDFVRNLVWAFPPIDEQQEIATILDDKVRGLKELAIRAEQVISLLKERRTTLIAAAVTGQIDVRGAI